MLQGIPRKIVYVTLFEFLAIAFNALILGVMTGQSAGHSGSVATLVSVIAVTWNLVFNSLFERWEKRRAVKGRDFKLRALHSASFEAGMVAFTLPVYMLAFSVSLGKAVSLQVAGLLFFLIYNFVFTLAFDSVFGLPASARNQGP